MRAQGIIFDILEVFGGMKPNVEVGIGQIMGDIVRTHGIGSAPTMMQTKTALELLVLTRELEVRGPQHDVMSLIYRRPA
jgi:hypothetical protein